ncbi:MAG: methylmalonyl-CoA epimerase [Gammaproteobacteria bacterium]|nr:MAG: methylmalonyl-CoA epimerase [Gammaproteobacteria bacterium]
MIGHLNHVAMVVPDLDAAARLYRDTLGASVSMPVELPEHGVVTIFVELGNTKVELLHPLGRGHLLRASLSDIRMGVFTMCVTRSKIFMPLVTGSSAMAAGYWVMGSLVSARTASRCCFFTPRTFVAL